MRAAMENIKKKRDKNSQRIREMIANIAVKKKKSVTCIKDVQRQSWALGGCLNKRVEWKEEIKENQLQSSPKRGKDCTEWFLLCRQSYLQKNCIKEFSTETGVRKVY